MIVLIGNKLDLLAGLSPTAAEEQRAVRQVFIDRILVLLSDRPTEVIVKEVSAKTGEGVTETFHEMVHGILLARASNGGGADAPNGSSERERGEGHVDLTASSSAGGAAKGGGGGICCS